MKKTSNDKKVVEKKARYGMRKLKVGYVSCLLGGILVFGQMIPSFSIAGIDFNNKVYAAQAQAVEDKELEAAKDEAIAELEKAKAEALEKINKMVDQNAIKKAKEEVQRAYADAAMKISDAKNAKEAKELGEKGANAIKNPGNITPAPNNNIDEVRKKAKEELNEKHKQIINALDNGSDYDALADKKAEIIKTLKSNLDSAIKDITTAQDEKTIEKAKEDGLVALQKEKVKADVLLQAASIKNKISEIPISDDEAQTKAKDNINKVVENLIKKIDEAYEQKALNEAEKEALKLVGKVGNLEKDKVQAKCDLEQSIENKISELENLKKEPNKKVTDEEISKAKENLKKVYDTEKEKIDSAQDKNAIDLALSGGKKEIGKIVNATKPQKTDAEKLKEAQDAAAEKVGQASEKRKKEIGSDDSLNSEQKKKAIAGLDLIIEKYSLLISDTSTPQEATAKGEEAVKLIGNTDVDGLIEIKKLPEEKYSSSEKIRKAKEEKQKEIDKIKDKALKEQAQKKLDQVFEDAKNKILNAATSEEARNYGDEGVNAIKAIDASEKTEEQKKLDKAKEDAKKDLEASFKRIHNALNDPNSYYGVENIDDIKTELEQKFSEAKQKIDACQSEAEVNTAKIEGLLKLQKVQAKADLLKVAANNKSEIRDIRDAEEEDRETAKKNIDSFVNTEIDKIESVKTQTDLLNTLRLSSEAVKNKGELEKAKVEAKGAVEIAVKAKKRELENLKSKPDSGFTGEQINNAIAEVDTCLKSAKDDIDKTNLETEAKDVVERVTKEINKITPNNGLEKEKEKAQEELKNAADNKKSEIDRMTDENAQKKARAELTEVYNNALDGVKNAKNKTEVENALTSGLEKIREIKTEKTASEKLDDAKKEAKAEIERARVEKQSAINSMTDKKSKEKAQEELNKVVADANDKIHAATKPEDAKRIAEDSVKKIKKISTENQSGGGIIDPLKSEKDALKKAIQDGKDARSSYNYRMSDYNRQVALDRSIEAAEIVLNKTNPSRDEIVNAIVALNNAIDNLSKNRKMELNSNSSVWSRTWFTPVDSPKLENKENKKVEKVEKVNVQSEKSYIFGYSDGTIRPDNNVTRAEAVAMLARLKGYDLNDNKKTEYKDSNSWYNKYINAAFKAGILVEKTDENFRPNDGMTRGEFVAIIANIDPKNDTKSPFKDIAGHKYEKAINQAFANRRINGYTDGSFKPDKVITRAEIVKILNNMFEIKDDNTTDELFLAKFKDINKKHWAYREIKKAVGLEMANTVK